MEHPTNRRFPMPQRRARRHLRAAFVTDVEVWKERAPTLVRASNISRSGVYLRTDEPLAEGAFLTLTLTLPGAGRFTALCRVARRDVGQPDRSPAGVGLEFVDLSRTAVACIEQWVDASSGRASLSP